MARLARVVAVDVAHHVTQRGNARQFILASQAERTVYLDLLRQALHHHPLSVIGYCLMSNHVHLVVIPRKEEALSKALKYAHGRYPQGSAEFVKSLEQRTLRQLAPRKGGRPARPGIDRHQERLGFDD